MSKKIFLALALCALIPGRAWAHATPVVYDPESGARLEIAPAAISIVFSERLEERASSIFVFAADGSRVEEGAARVDAQDAHRLSVPLRSLEVGSYTVSWQVVSADDGHFTKGAYAFGVGIAPAAGVEKFEVSHSSAVPEAATSWLELLGQAILVAAVTMRALPQVFSLASPERLARMVRFGALLVVVGALAFVLLKTSQLASVRSVGFIDALVPFVVTNASMAALIRAALATLVLIFWRSAWVIAGIATIGMVVLRSVISHAAASKTLPELSVGVNAVHLFFKDLWIGTIILAVEVFLPIKDRLATKAFLKYIGRLTIVSLLIAGITGVYIVWLHLKGFGNVLGTSWGRMFVLLSLAGGMLFAARLAGWYALRVRATWQKHLGTFLVFEMFAGILVLFMTALIIITTPPLGAPEMVLADTQSNGARVILKERLAEPGSLMIEVESTSRVRDVVVTLTNAAYSIGPIVAPLERRFDGGYIVPKDIISPPGNWRFDVTAQREGVYDAVASYEGAWPPEAHGRDHALEMMLGLVLLGVIAVSAFLWWWIGGITFDGELSISGADFQRGLIAALVCAVVMMGMQSTVLKSTFQSACERSGDGWHVMQPMRGGKVLGDAALEGCMTADGKNHFTDQREYEYFKK